jgi:hypothetical protein
VQQIDRHRTGEKAGNAVAGVIVRTPDPGILNEILSGPVWHSRRIAWRNDPHENRSY